MRWQRARNEKQKQERREAILAAAEKLFESEGLENVSLNGIARCAGVSKANIYRYFESREAIYLQLAREEFEKWTTDVEHCLAPLAGSNNEKAVARALVKSLTDNPKLANLLAMMGSVLEQNVTVEAVIEFKKSCLGYLLRLTNAVQVSMPGLTSEKSRQFIAILHILVVGIWPASHPAAAVTEALKRPELQGMRVDFEKDLSTAVVAMLRGLGVSPGTG